MTCQDEPEDVVSWRAWAAVLANHDNDDKFRGILAYREPACLALGELPPWLPADPGSSSSADIEIVGSMQLLNPAPVVEGCEEYRY